MSDYLDPASLNWTEDGLIPAVVQDADSGVVLMLGWMNAESLARSQDTGLVHFWSRSRQRLWQKGETSGNELRLRNLAADCDADVILVLAEPAGPTCHTNAISCFDGTARLRPTTAQLGALWRVIAQRTAERPGDSYTTTLLGAGVDAVARKVTEEATEVLMAAKDHAVGGSVGPVVSESADLLYHLFVLWAERGIDPRSVMSELEARTAG